MRTFFFLCFCIGAAWRVNAAQSVDVIALEYPPFTTAFDSTNGTAFTLLNTYASQHFSFAVKPLILPPARAQQRILSGDWCLSFYPPANRENYPFIALSEQQVKLGLFRKKQASVFQWQSLDELSGKRLGIFRALQNQGIHSIFEQLDLVYIETLHQGFSLLLADRVDYVFGDNAAIGSSPVYADFVEQLQFSDTVLMQVPVGVFVNPECKAVAGLTEPLKD